MLRNKLRTYYAPPERKLYAPFATLLSCVIKHTSFAKLQNATGSKNSDWPLPLLPLPSESTREPTPNHYRAVSRACAELSEKLVPIYVSNYYMARG